MCVPTTPFHKTNELIHKMNPSKYNINWFIHMKNKRFNTDVVDYNYRYSLLFSYGDYVDELYSTNVYPNDVQDIYLSMITL